MEMTDKTLFLALYTGPQGPISAHVEAWDVDYARALVESDGSEWYDNGNDVLGLDPDSDTLDSDIDAALEGWELVSPAITSDGYAIYRPAEPERQSEKPDYYFQIVHPTDPYADPIQGSGSLDDALEFARTHDQSVELYDRPGWSGFKLGWVHADGNYRLC